MHFKNNLLSTGRGVDLSLFAIFCRMNPIYNSLKIRMVTIPDPFLKVWWRFMNNDDKMIVQKHIGHLLSLLEMNVWPGLI